MKPMYKMITMNINGVPTACPKTVLPSNNSLLVKLFKNFQIFIIYSKTLILTHQPVKSDKNSWKYTNSKIKSRFYERQNLGNFG